MSITRICCAAAVGVALALGASACSSTPTISGESLAEQAADALEEQVGSRPEMDCGDEDIPIEEDSVAECVLTDPSSGEQYNTDVTITDVDGTDFHIDVQVDETPVS